MSQFVHHTLSNGLTVLLKELHHAPVISFWVTYRVGSRHEVPGITGISHWVEHMMFKGTPKFPVGTLDKAIDRLGGQWNAMTSLDYTMYYATLPTESIDLALEVEADRMMNAQFDPDETESERTVIISERQGSENSPLFWLREELQAVAFRVHSYHHRIIGDMIDLERMTRDDLYRHYRQYYIPNNAVIAVTGDFQAAEMLAKIEEQFGGLPAGDLPTFQTRPEPPQQGERRVTVHRPGETAFLYIAFHAPPATHPDWFKLDLLDSILTGPGGGIDNKTSRLYGALVQSEIASVAAGSMTETVDPFLYGIIVQLRDGRSPVEAEAIISAEIDKIAREGVSEAEVAKAKKQARAAFVYGSESITDQAYYMAQSAILGDFQWDEQYLERLEAITPADIQQAAQQYLNPRNRIVGWLLPDLDTDQPQDTDDDNF